MDFRGPPIKPAGSDINSLSLQSAGSHTDPPRSALFGSDAVNDMYQVESDANRSAGLYWSSRTFECDSDSPEDVAFGLCVVEVRTVVMHDSARLRALISEYIRLVNRYDGAMTPQVRGTRFNELIADVLRVWGIRARTSTVAPGAGEIDVSFTLGGHHFIVEAKWEQSRTDAGPIGKLILRLGQRLQGTIGVFISMAGYTSDAITSLTTSGERSMFLLDRSHVEAMVTGLVSPEELFSLALERAAFTGERHVPLLDLLASDRSAPSVAFYPPPDVPVSPVADGMSIQLVCTVQGTEMLGMTSDGQSLLLIHPDGIIEVDPGKQKAAWRIPVQGAHGAPIPMPGERVVFARQHGVAMVTGDSIEIVGGGFSDRSILFAKENGSVWVLDPMQSTGTQTTSALVRLGTSLGDEQRHEITTPHPWPVGAIWLDDAQVVLIHESACSLIRLDAGLVGQLRLGTHDCVGLVRLDADTFLTVGGRADIRLSDIATQRGAYLGELSGGPAARGIAAGGGHSAYLAVGVDAHTTAILAVEIQPAIAEFVTLAFARADSGDLKGYRAEVARLTHQHSPWSDRTHDQLAALFNDATQQVHQELARPILDQAKRLGFTLITDSPGQSLDGMWPPGYGGGASTPRWRLADHNNAWLEASVGVSHKAWPTENLNDLVITLMIAIRTDQQQRTLLTRFVPFTAGEADLAAKIDATLTDATKALTQALKLLAEE